MKPMCLPLLAKPIPRDTMPKQRFVKVVVWVVVIAMVLSLAIATISLFA